MRLVVNKAGPNNLFEGGNCHSETQNVALFAALSSSTKMVNARTGRGGIEAGSDFMAAAACGPGRTT